MKYIHVYNDENYCESDSFKDTPNTIVLTDDQYKALCEGSLTFKNGMLVVNSYGNK